MIKNIIFDLGGVLLDIDFNLSNMAFAAIGVDNFKQYISQHYADDLFERFETGMISIPAFFNEFRQRTKTSVTDEQITEAWNAMLLHFSKDKMHLLEELSRKYRVYLFSNTNELHVNYFTDLCMREIGKPLESYFIKTWYSNEVGFRKPYAASFTKLLNAENLLPEETLFVDDTIGNIAGAKEAGMHTFHLEAPKTIFDIPFLENHSFTSSKSI